MVGGAHGQAGQHARQRVGVVRELDNVLATILYPQGVEVIVLVAIPVNRHAVLPVAQVRLLTGLAKHLYCIIRKQEIFLTAFQVSIWLALQIWLHSLATECFCSVVTSNNG